MKKTANIFDNLPKTFSYHDGLAYLRNFYKAPDKQLQYLEKSGEIIRLKRGVYSFARNFDPYVASNQLCQPSYISFETALAYYDLIPERVEEILSVVDGRYVTYATPMGTFTYRPQTGALYAAGMSLGRSGDDTFLIASPEKALLDTLAHARLKAQSMTPDGIKDYIIAGLRVDEDVLASLSAKKITRLAKLYHNKAPAKLAAAVTMMNK